MLTPDNFFWTPDKKPLSWITGFLLSSFGTVLKIGPLVTIITTENSNNGKQAMLSHESISEEIMTFLIGPMSKIETTVLSHWSKKICSEKNARFRLGYL